MAEVRGRVGLVYPRVAMDSVPTLCQMVDLFARHGYAVDVFTLTSPDVPDPVFDPERVRLVPLGSGSVAGGSGVAAARRLGPLKPLLAPLGRVYRAAQRQRAAGADSARRAALREEVAREHGQRPYACFIGVDDDGLDLACAFADRTGAAVGYVSLELLLSEAARTAEEQRRKARERAQLQRAAFVLVQDEQRGRLLADDNGLPWERLVLAPNAPLGPARRRPARVWHERFGLAAGQRVVLHAGSLGDWTGIEDIVASVPGWPSKWVLVVHTRYDAESSAYVDRLRATATPGRVFFSLKPVARQQYDALIDAADVGIAFYVASGESAYTRQNIQTIGLSSGKLAYYLRAGLPVIVNDASSIADVVRREGCGVAVRDGARIPAALDDIERSYARLSAGALAMFDRHLDFARSFETVLERVDQLTPRPETLAV